MTHFKSNLLRRPGAWLLAGAALAFISVASLTACDSGDGPSGPVDTYDSLHVPLSTLLDTGAVMYGNCSGCHGNGGVGSPGGTPPHANSDFFMNNKRKTIEFVIAGHSDSILVNGLWYEAGMPSFEGSLTNMEIASVLTYIRVQLNDSTVTNCNANVLDENGFATCTKTARTPAERNADTVAVWEVKAVHDSILAAATP